MKLKYLTFVLIFGAVSLSIISCGDDEEPTCETTGLTYTNFASDFITNNCWDSGCHESGTTATFEMSDFTTTSAAVGFGRILGAINHEDGFSNMPKGRTQLDDCSISKLTAWINDGAPE